MPSRRDPHRRNAPAGAPSAADPEAEAPLHLRLHGRLDAGEVSFVPGDGGGTVGSAADNDLVLAQRGVSRHHARLRRDAGGWQVEDLGSKNGSFVNGRRVEGDAPVSAGDEVRFGPVELRAETVAAGDVDLALELSWQAPSGAPPTPSTTRQLTRAHDEPALAWLRCLEAVLERLHGGDEAAGALRALVRDLGLTGAAWLSVGGAGGSASGSAGGDDPVVLAAAGGVGTLPTAARLRALAGDAAPRIGIAAPQGDGDAQREDTTPPRTLAVLALRGGGGLALVLWGDFAGRQASAPLLRPLLHALAAHHREPLAGIDKAAAPPPELDFPDGYQPGDSIVMRELYRQMAGLVDADDLPVLLVGETGSGKEPLARALHRTSPRRRGPFVAVNCAAIPAELLEAEMFGIGRGVATGVEARRGRLEEADGGTLLLDEVGDMPPPLQAKLLRALQEREVQPVGRAAVPLDVRLIAATNQDLAARVEDGGFRRDLYFRLAGAVLRVPPLRARPDDLPALVGCFLSRFAHQTGKRLRGLTVKALRHLQDYPWPGNVRELEHEIRRLVHLCPDGGAIDSSMLTEQVLAPPPGLVVDDAPGGGETLELARHTEALEGRLIRLALARTGGNQTQAAKLLGLSRNGLANRIRRLHIDP